MLNASNAGMDAIARPAAKPGGSEALSALCILARLHHIAGEPESLAHELGLTPSMPLADDDLLRAAAHLGLKAKFSRSTVDRLNLSPLPALAKLNDGRWVVLAQCDG